MWQLEYLIWPEAHSSFSPLNELQIESVPWSPDRRWERSRWCRFFSISLLCPWLCANMGDQQLSWCGYMCNGGEAAESEVRVGAEDLTGCVNRAWLPWELMAIDHPRPRNDRSYLELGMAMWDSCLCVCAMPTVCFRYSLFKSLEQRVQTLCKKTWGKHPRCTQCHCISDTPPPSCSCYHCDRWPCEFLLFLTPLPALHIRKRNSCAACKKELCVCGSRGLSFLWPEHSCSVGGSKLSALSRQNNVILIYSVITP